MWRLTPKSSAARSRQSRPVTRGSGRGSKSLSKAVVAASEKPAPVRRLAALEGGERRNLKPLGRGAGSREAALRDLYGKSLPLEVGGARRPRRRASACAHGAAVVAGASSWRDTNGSAGRPRAPAGTRRRATRPTSTDRIDRSSAHKIFGPVVLLLVMLVVFQTHLNWAALPMDLSTGLRLAGRGLRRGCRRGF